MLGMNRIVSSVSSFGAVAGVGLAGISALSLPAMAGSAAPSVAIIEIEGTPAEVEAGFTWLGDGAQTLLGLIETLDTLAVDDEFSGVLIRLKDSALGYTQVEELSAAMQRLRDAGKRVDVFAEGYGTTDLLLGAHADEVLIQTGGGVSFPGLYMEEMFLADTLEWVGVQAQLVQVGAYKGANEQMTRSSPSPEWDQNISSLLDAMYSNMRRDMKGGRDLSDAQLDEAMKVSWMADGGDAVRVGLIDAEVDLPDLPEYLRQAYGADVQWVRDPYAVAGSGSMDFSNPFALLSQLGESSVQVNIDHPTIAVLHINGTIIDGDSSSGGLFGGGTSVGSRTIRNAIEDIIKEPLIQGVVIRVDSPGGSAIASEVMWQGVQRLREEKPVWVSVGGMAASGGYYVLSAGEKVFVNPSSVVGSIGVVGGKYSMAELYEKAQIKIVGRARGPMADLFGSADAWDAQQIAAVRERMTSTYDLFTSRVTAGRPGIDLGETAEGRLFVGSDAIDLNMADELGGLDDAVNELAYELDVADFDVVHYPAPPGFEDVLQNMLGGIAEAPGAEIGPASLGSMLRKLIGDARYEAAVDTLNGITLLQNEPVLLINPRTIFIR
ncbi:MAG: S49 family peptidase [Phycisphaerales bacterium]